MGFAEFVRFWGHPRLRDACSLLLLMVWGLGFRVQGLFMLNLYSKTYQHTPWAYPLKEVKGCGKILPYIIFIFSIYRLRGMGWGHVEFCLDIPETLIFVV